MGYLEKIFIFNIKNGTDITIYYTYINIYL